MTTLPELRQEHKLFFSDAKSGETYNIRNTNTATFLVTTLNEEQFDGKRVMRSVVWEKDGIRLKKVDDFVGDNCKQRALWFIEDIG